MTERARLDLYRRLEEVLGAVNAETLMSELPPSNWPDLVTRQELRAELAEFRAEMRGEIAQATRTIILTVVFAMIGAVLTTASLAFAA